MRRIILVLGLLLVLTSTSCNATEKSEEGYTSPHVRSPDPVDNSRLPIYLDEVQTWLYLIDVNLGDDTVDQIEASTYDMVVLDFIPSEGNNTDYPMAEVVTRFHEADHPKLVLAYIDIGEAEDYRTLGFIPFIGNRALDSYIEPIP